MYRFVKDTNSSRLFVQGTREGTDKDNIFENGIISEQPRQHDSMDSNRDFEALHTRRRLTTEVEGSSQETSRIQKNKHEGRKLITTRIIRKTTTLTRGEEQTVSESLLRSAGNVVNVVPIGRSPDLPAIQAKRARVSPLWLRRLDRMTLSLSM